MGILENLTERHLEHETHMGMKEQKEAEELKEKVILFNAATMEIVDLKDQGMAIDTLLEKREELFHPVLVPLLEQLDEYTATHIKEMGQAGQTINRTYDFGLRFFFLMAGLLTLLTVIVTVVIIRSITKPLLELHRGTEKIGEGYLGYRVGTKAKDEIGQLSRAFDLMTANLQMSTTSIDSLNREIVERKQAEQVLEEKNQQFQAQSEELREKSRSLELASQAKSEFLSSMSHELRTPLNAVIGFSELMIDEVPGEVNEEQRQCLDDILSSGHHLLELINDVLDLSKVEAGKMEFRAEELELSEVIHEVTQTVSPLVNKAGNSLEIDIADELPLVYADKSRLRQVLLNLLSNAIKFTPKGGNIGIEAHQEGDYCQVSVSDNGLGIKTEDLERVFEVFVQAETLTEKKQEGTGLGLPLTKQFVEKMGGKIWLESEYGKGSCFSFTIPLVGEGKRQSQKEEEQEQRLSKVQQDLLQKGKLVLVVDDDRKTRTLLRSWLETAGYNIAEASSGDEGISKARELQPTLIILDILMPGKDGWQVLQELKQLPETKEIPVIVSSVTKEEEMGFSLGAIDFFVKPVEKKRFLKRVDELELNAEKRVLVVEDNPIDMRLVTSILKAEGIGTLCACEGEEGLRMAEEQLPSLIVLDINMPRMNGFEVIERLRNEEKTRDIPVIILTVKDLTQAETKKLSQTVSAILKKTSFSKEELIAEIRKLVKLGSE